MVARGPIFCDIGITESCLFRCRMCRLWQTPASNQELSIEEWKGFIRSLEEFGSPVRIHVAGGEPLLKEGLLDLMGFANARGFTTVMVSNGFLIDQAMASRIVGAGVDVISVSLDTLDEKKHDFLRGQDTAHRHALRAIDHLSGEGAKAISILAVIMEPNLEDLVQLAEWVESKSAISSIYFQVISQPIATSKDEHWYSQGEFSYLWPKDRLRTDAVLNQLISLKRSGYKISNTLKQLDAFKQYFQDPHSLHNGQRCTQGDYVMYIRPAGDVLLCGSMDPVGNIRKAMIKNIWFSPEAEATREKIYRCGESCLNKVNCFVDKELP